MSAVSTLARESLVGLPLPLLVTLTIAVVALVCIGVAVRRFRLAGTLTVANASTSAAAAAFVLAAALLASVALGAATPAVAGSVRPVLGVDSGVLGGVVTEQPDGFQPVVIEDLEGYQLPTE